MPLDLKFNSEIVRFSGCNGIMVEAVCVYRAGDVGVTRANDVDYWTLSDLVSGFAVPYKFDDFEIAAMAADEISERIKWRALVDNMGRGVKPNHILIKIIEILEAHGAVHKENPNVGTPAELAARLAGGKGN